jgi:hypothetical protein
MNSYKKKTMEATKQIRKKPKPEEHDGMPPRLHCPPAKRRGERNSEYHEEQQKDVA